MSFKPTTRNNNNNNNNHRATMNARGYPGTVYDRQTARQMVAAIQYVPTPEETAYAAALEQERKDRKAAKKGRKQHLVSDTASVSSFGSTVSLLKFKFSRKSHDSKTASKGAA